MTNAEFVKFLNAVKRRGNDNEPWFETKAEDSDSHITGSVGNFQVETGCSSCGDDFNNTSPVGSFGENKFGLYDTS